MHPTPQVASFVEWEVPHTFVPKKTNTWMENREQAIGRFERAPTCGISSMYIPSSTPWTKVLPLCKSMAPNVPHASPRLEISEGKKNPRVGPTLASQWTNPSLLEAKPKLHKPMDYFWSKTCNIFFFKLSEIGLVCMCVCLEFQAGWIGMY